MSDMDDIVQEFLVESYEGLDRLDADLVTLEQTPDDLDTLARIFRTIHTVKGTCGFLGFSRLEKVAHVGESLLSLLRDGALALNPERTTGLLHLVDAVREMLAHIEATGNESDEEYKSLIADLERLQKDQESTAAAPAASTPSPAPAEAASAAPAASVDEPAVELPAPMAPAIGVETPVAVAAEVPVEEPHPAMTALSTHGDDDEGEPVAGRPRATAGKNDRGQEMGNIRVSVGLLDKLMNLVGELVLARNQILQFTKNVDDPNFQATAQRLNHITTELQEGVMKTRMQPIGSIWTKFPRVVRDLAITCKKQVSIDMEGKETELDRTLIEAIKDPLTHIVRNSVDHGIEAPEVRRERGKPEEGILKLKAFHEGGQVIVEISDDGGGIDPRRLKAKVLEKGLMPESQLEKMTDHELTNLIFLPGFSTAEKVTNVSGRGVGMDVVKTNIEKIGGTVDIQSEPGYGTTLRVKIPLTLAIIPALIVTCHQNRYAIPQVSLLELLMLERTEKGNGIEFIHGTPFYRLRGNLLPIIHLDRELGMTARTVAEDCEQETVNIVVLQAEDRPFGLVVDGVLDTEEIVVKPLAKMLNNIPCFAGATIMGDGKVALILDVMGLAQTSKVIAQARDSKVKDDHSATQSAASEMQTLLLFSVGENRRMAIDLSSVDRLEELSPEAVEHSSHQEVVQYRGQIMRLLRLSNYFGECPRSADIEAPLQVVVYSRGGKSIGLIVDQIIDIVRDSLQITSPASGPGICSSAVVQGHVTDILDVAGIVGGVFPDLSVELVGS